ncbi:MAG: efflux RND transporter periplasmic adaptor subunit [Bacteroidales bacterium]|jgi:RND family efflux transporter MFP subunit|nr:efflux RND transporter periplasmic adaptor subunit [Bacteroidales bacterium]
MMRNIYLLSMSATVLLSGCSVNTGTRGNDSSEQKIIPVKVMSVQRSATAASVSYIGTISESFALSLSFSGMGVVEQVLVSEGQAVSKGQTLATLNTATAQSAYQAAQATLRQAQDAYDRLATLHEGGSISDIKFVEVETGLQQAKSMLTVAERSLNDCRLTAPRSGVIARRSIEPGTNAAPGVPAFTLITVDRVDAKIAVPENEIGDVSLHQEAIIEATALAGERFTGTVETKGVSAHPLTHTYKVKIRINNTADAKSLLPGMVCKVWLQQPEKSAGTVIPARIVQIAPDGQRFVWLANGDTARRRFIKTGALNDDGVTVNDGLNDGDRLIIEGYQKVSEGMKINIIN